MKLYQAFLWMMIASLTLAAALGVWALLIPRTGWVQEYVLISSLLVGAFSLPAFGCAIVLHRRRDRPIMWLGIAAAAGALAVWLAAIWTQRMPWWIPDDVWRIGGSLTTLTLWAAHFGLLRLAKLSQPWARMVSTATLALGGLLALTIIIAMWAEPIAEEFWRLLAVLSILAVCGTIVTPILTLIELIATRGMRESLPSSMKIALTCPRCGSSEQVAAGAGRCAGCGLRIAIDIEEPRCTCGYLLHKLVGEQCPECGRTIPDADRWHITKSAAAVEPARAEAKPDDTL